MREELLAAVNDEAANTLEVALIHLASFLPEPDGSIAMGIVATMKSRLPQDPGDVAKFVDDPEWQSAMEQASRLSHLVAQRTDDTMAEVRRLREVRGSSV